MRLQKILSQAGVASRRAAEKLIIEGRVSVNGQTIRQLGSKADPARDDIRVDGRRIKPVERPCYILLNKPRGYVTTRSDEKRRKTVMDLLEGVREYVYPVGRLDYDTEGLLLLTNDGELAAALTHPRHGVERTYEARVAGMPDERALEKLRTGIPLDGRRTMPADVILLNKDRRDAEGVLLITIREGRNRQVRRMCEAVGHPVARLKRTRIGPISDRRLPTGAWRELSPEEVRRLRSIVSRGDKKVAVGRLTLRDKNSHEGTTGHEGTTFTKGHEGAKFTKGHEGTTFTKGHEGAKFTTGHEGTTFTKGHKGRKATKRGRGTRRH